MKTKIEFDTSKREVAIKMLKPGEVFLFDDGASPEGSMGMVVDTDGLAPSSDNIYFIFLNCGALDCVSGNKKVIPVEEITIKVVLK